MKNTLKGNGNRIILFFYDVIILLSVCTFLMGFYVGNEHFTKNSIITHTTLLFLCVFTFRLVFSVYKQVWRYGGIQGYIFLLVSDTFSGLVYCILNYTLPLAQCNSFAKLLAIVCMNTLASLIIRMSYRYLYKTGKCRFLIDVFSFGRVKITSYDSSKKIRIAIVGAGRVGVSLAEELFNNPVSIYVPRCFIEVSEQKIGREIYGLPVLMESDATLENLAEYQVQEIVFALPQLSFEKRESLLNYYKDSGYPVKNYDYHAVQGLNSKPVIREFDVEELLFRKQNIITDENTKKFYNGKTVLITGGGGSIGSELGRQLAKMNPRQLVILDVYENGAYDLQQELKILYADNLDVKVVIVSVCNRTSLERVFKQYRPDVVINAAAHKHVPLMEDSPNEAIKNNVMGTWKTASAAAANGVDKFVMISTDKAVNPTNIMGASKRICEMIIQTFGHLVKE